MATKIAFIIFISLATILVCGPYIQLLNGAHHDTK